MRQFSFWHKWHERERDEAGQSLVIIAFVLVGILAFVGIAVDVGFVFARSSQLQSAVDAAALAGVTELLTNKDAADTKAGQFLNANRIPITNTQGIDVTFESAQGLSPLGAAEYSVTVTWPVELFFLRVLGLRDVDLTRSATAATFFLTDIYASRRVEEGTVGTSMQGIFGPQICTSYGDPFSPWSSLFAPGPYTYRYRILIPSDYTEDVVRVELFDPDSVNDPTNNAQVSHTVNTQNPPGNLPAAANKSCGTHGGRVEQKHPCVLRTDELALYESEIYELDTINPFWFLRVDENRGAGSPPGNNSCGEPGSYNTGFNTQTQYQLYYFQQSPDGNPVRVDLASYTGNTGDSRDINGFHNTDLHWVSPGGTQAADGPAVPVDPGSPRTFELNIANDLTDILTDAGTGNRYVYLDVTALSGSSENAFEIWAGPNTYSQLVPSQVNARNVFVRNNPGAHNSRGVAVFALTNLPMNAIYGNTGPDDPVAQPDRPVDIPLLYVGPEYAGSSVLVSLFDSDSGARPPVIFYFDTLGFTPSDSDPKGYDLTETDWAMAFGVAGQTDPDGQSRNCVPGSCNDQYVLPAYNIQVPGIVDNCDWDRVDGMTDPPQEADWIYRRDNCTPFYGGRLVARYIGGETDTYGWQIQLTGLPYLVD